MKKLNIQQLRKLIKEELSTIQEPSIGQSLATELIAQALYSIEGDEESFFDRCFDETVDINSIDVEKIIHTMSNYLNSAFITQGGDSTFKALLQNYKESK